MFARIRVDPVRHFTFSRNIFYPNSTVSNFSRLLKVSLKPSVRQAEAGPRRRPFEAPIYDRALSRHLTRRGKKHAARRKSFNWRRMFTTGVPTGRHRRNRATVQDCRESFFFAGFSLVQWKDVERLLSTFCVAPTQPGSKHLLNYPNQLFNMLSYILQCRTSDSTASSTDAGPFALDNCYLPKVTPIFILLHDFFFYRSHFLSPVS